MSTTRLSPAIGVPVAIVRLVLGGLFIFAASMKLQDIQGFAFSVAAFDIFPKSADHLTRLVAFAVPWAELLAGLLLILGLWTRAASAILSVLLLAFIAGIVSVMMRHLQVSCGCFGRFEVPCTGPVGPCHIARNSVLLAVSLFVFWMGPGTFAVDRQSD
jgi:uncharacterized membrane protein YphA (DoxX/SURF4 family)